MSNKEKYKGQLKLVGTMWAMNLLCFLISVFSWSYAKEYNLWYEDSMSIMMNTCILGKLTLSLWLVIVIIAYFTPDEGVK